MSVASKRHKRRTMKLRQNEQDALVEETCSRKQPFHSEEAAARELTKLIAARPHDGGVMNVYKCRVNDNHWHFGHAPKQEKRK